MKGYFCHPHFTDEETGTGTSGNQAKVTELASGRAGIQTPACKLSSTTVSSQTRRVQIFDTSLTQCVALDKWYHCTEAWFPHLNE